MIKHFDALILVLTTVPVSRSRQIFLLVIPVEHLYNMLQWIHIIFLQKRNERDLQLGHVDEML
jgi:hypothetical protein